MTERDDERLRRLARPVPRWRDVEALTERVADEIEELRSEVDRLAWTTTAGAHGDDASKDLRAVFDLVMAEGSRGWPPTSECAAVEAARRGDVKPLANLLRPVCGMGLAPDKVSPEIERFSLETWTLIADFLTGERNPKTGRMRGEPGRPKMSTEERRARNRAHDAIDEIPVIRAILRRLYPEQDANQINDRAEEIAQRRKNIAVSLQNLRRRSKKSGHRA
jgi:hypothetical protein